MGIRRLAVDARTPDWPREAANRINSLITQLEQFVAVAGSAAAASIDFITLEGDANTDTFDGLLLEGDAQTSGADFLLY